MFRDEETSPAAAAAQGGGPKADVSPVPHLHVGFKAPEGVAQSSADGGGRSPRGLFSPRAWFTPRGTKIGVLAAEEEPATEALKQHDATVEVQVREGS
jgi:hypothetical protein